MTKIRDLPGLWRKLGGQLSVNECAAQLEAALEEDSARAAPPAPRPIPVGGKAWISAQEAADHIGMSSAHLAKLRMTGRGPAFVKMGRGKQGAVRYERAALDAWLLSKTRASTSENP